MNTFALTLDYSSEYNCLGLPIDRNTNFNADINYIGCLFSIGITSAILVKQPIATIAYLTLSPPSRAKISIISISNSNLAPGETKLLLPLGLDFTCMSPLLLR